MDHLQLRHVSKMLTPEGLISLGLLIQRSRFALKNDKGRAYGYRALSALIKERTGVGVGKDTLQRLEEGRIKQPSPDTFLALAGAAFLLDENGNPYRVEDLLRIAAGELIINSTQPEIKTQGQTDEE